MGMLMMNLDSAPECDGSYSMLARNGVKEHAVNFNLHEAEGAKWYICGAHDL